MRFSAASLAQELPSRCNCALRRLTTLTLQPGLSYREIDVAQDEKGGEDPEQQADLAEFSRAVFYHCVGNHAEAQACRDAERERRGEHGYEGRKSVAEIVPVHPRY